MQAYPPWPRRACSRCSRYRCVRWPGSCSRRRLAPSVGRMPWPPGRCQGGDFPGRTPAHQVGPCGVWKATMSRLITTSMAHCSAAAASAQAVEPNSPLLAERGEQQSPAQWRRSEQLRRFRGARQGRTRCHPRPARWSMAPRTPSRSGRTPTRTPGCRLARRTGHSVAARCQGHRRVGVARRFGMPISRKWSRTHSGTRPMSLE